MFWKAFLMWSLAGGHSRYTPSMLSINSSSVTTNPETVISFVLLNSKNHTHSNHLNLPKQPHMFTARSNHQCIRNKNRCISTIVRLFITFCIASRVLVAVIVISLSLSLFLSLSLCLYVLCFSVSLTSCSTASVLLVLSLAL